MITGRYECIIAVETLLAKEARKRTDCRGNP